MSSEEFKSFKRKAAAELRPYREGEPMKGISISTADRRNGSPKKGDMIARNPDDHSDIWLVARDFFKKNYVSEAGGSGYSTAFTHPDPIDPNDVVRQKTQSRAGNYPYDSPVSYGGPIGTDLGGAAYQKTSDVSPPNPRHKKPSDAIPYGQYGTAWEQAGSMLGTYSPGEQADDALLLGYGSHGRLGEEDFDSIDLQGIFDLPASIEDDDVDLSLLTLLSNDSDCGCQDDDNYDDEWDERIYAPGAEYDLT